MENKSFFNKKMKSALENTNAFTLIYKPEEAKEILSGAIEHNEYLKESENLQLLFKKLYWWTQNNKHLLPRIKTILINDKNPDGKEVETRMPFSIFLEKYAYEIELITSNCIFDKEERNKLWGK